MNIATTGLRKEFTLLFALTLADVLLLAFTRYTLALHGFALVSLGGVFFLGLWIVYGRLRPEPRLAGLARTALLFTLGTAALGTLSYLLAGLSPRPLFDAQLAALDRAIGCDWPAYHRLLLSTPALAHLTQWSYGALGIELIVLILMFDPIGRPDRARELFLGFTLTAIAVVLLGAVFPAAGAFVYYATPESHTEPYVIQYLALRNGSLHVLDPRTMQGIVQFPSFHAALAVICLHATRGMRWLFWPLLPMTLLVIASTPAAGGHHFSDVLAGLFIAGMVIALLRRALRHT
ncbi:MAG: phosphatase PAP2 family protein [Stenotrophobium sp.]